MSNLVNNPANNSVSRSVKRTIVAYKQDTGRKNFTSYATTLGELKEELAAQGFDTNNTKISEGVTNITLENDSAILPTNVEYRGKTTNDLVIIMTPQAKPKSGSVGRYGNLDRNALYSKVQELRNSPESRERAEEDFYKYTNMSNLDLRETLALWDEKYNDVPTTDLDNTEINRFIVREVVSSTPAMPFVESLLGASDAESQKELIKAVIREYNEEEKIVSVAAAIDREAYDDAIEHILYGVMLLQNNVLGSQKPVLPSEEELEEMANRFNA